MSIAPYTYFNGTCAEAMEVYCAILGGDDLQIMRYKDMPDSGSQSDRVMHASFQLDGAMLLASDFPEGMDWHGKSGTSLHVTKPDAKSAKAAFDRLAEGGTVDMPFAETFWSKGFGMVTDRWGTHWMLSTPD